MVVLREQFDRQLAEILQGLEAAGVGKGHAPARTKALLDDFIDWSAARQAMKDAVMPVLLSVITDTGRQAMNDIDLEASLFNPFAEAIGRFYDSRASKVAMDVTDTTEKLLRTALTEGFQAGESTFELRGRVEEVMGNASTYRADMIARTEVARAQGFADIEAWTQSGVVSGKEFFTARDEKVCFFCNEMDGVVIGLNENFFDRGDALEVDGKVLDFGYDDVDTACLHPNCRCTLLPARA